MTTAAESDNSVDDFLKTISLLGEKRNKEDDERARKLEAEILQGRRERQARRAGLSHLHYTAELRQLWKPF